MLTRFSSCSHRLFMKIFSLIWRIFKFIRQLVINLVFIVFTLCLITVISLISHYSTKSSTELIGDQGALVLKLDGYLVDSRESPIVWQDALRELNGQSIPRQLSTFDIVYALENATDDDRIKGLVLDLNQFEGGELANLDYLGEAILSFKKSNKPVIAVADSYDQKQYFLASFADHIYLNPIGDVEITGLQAENLYFKSLLDKLGISTHIFRVGTYKSAVEPFLRDDMSAEAKSDLQQWLGKMWQNYQQTVANNRQINLDQVLPDAQTYIKELKKLKGDNSQYTLQRGLITEFADRFTINQKLIEFFGKDHQKDSNAPKLLALDDYLASLPDLSESDATHKIAVVNVEGAIIDGESYEQEVGGDTIARLLRQAYNDSAVKAVVLRVNSPGGSAFASEIIRQELVHLQQAGKPAVVSMGGMAASGGYWISSTADYIVAEKNTITGSIGIFSLFPSFEKTLKKIGVSADKVSTSPFAEMSSYSGLSPELNDILQLQIEQGYDRFLSLVSQGRNLSKEQVDKIAQGKIWLGGDALTHKLVDEIGSFDIAVDKAIELVNGKLENKLEESEFDVIWLQEEDKFLLGSMLKGFQSQLKIVLTDLLLENIPLAKTHQKALQNFGLLTQMNDPKGHYLYCLTCAEIR